MTIDDLVPAAGRASPREDVGTAGDRQLEPSSSRRCRHQHKAGTVVDVEVTSVDLVLAGRDCRIVLAQDVTERNKAAAELVAARDQAVEASNMKSAFLANVSHEIRTPMNGVIGMNELLLETELSDDQRAFAEQVARSGQQLLEVINDILDVATIEAGRSELNVADFDLRATISRACAVAEAEASTKGLRLDRWIAHEVPQHVRGDSQRLQTVVANLACTPSSSQPQDRWRWSTSRRAPAETAGYANPHRDRRHRCRHRRAEHGAHVRAVHAGRRIADPQRQAAPASAWRSSEA